MNQPSIEIVFSVKVKYSYEAGTPFFQESAKSNLLAAIENERQNGGLTPCDISADSVVVEEEEQDHNAFGMLDVDMSSVVGEYENPDDVIEWKWVERNASLSHKDNGKLGIWDFMLNIAVEHTNIPAKLLPVINSAKYKGYTYILFNQGT
jgi:hypothetical protein